MEEGVADIINQLLKIDLEADWSISEVEAADGAERHFERYLGRVLQVLQDELGADQGYVAISSLDCGFFTPFVAVGQQAEKIPRTPTFGGVGWLPRHLESGDTFQIITPGTVTPPDRDLAGVGQRVLIKLLGHGELFGFICLDRRQPDRFSNAVLGELRHSVPVLVSQVAEENFSMRVRQLAGPFVANEPAALYQEIIERTARGFAADGAVLRIYYPEFETLTVEAHRGEIDPRLLKDRAPGEAACGRVLIDPNHNWARIMRGEPVNGHGIVIPETELRHLREADIQALLIMRLESDLVGPDKENRIGTLSYFLRRPHRFSWRDVALFRSFCQRIGDTIALQRQTAKLIESYDDLHTSHLILNQQSAGLTRVEIVSLIAHDLFHKSFHTCKAVSDYIEKCRKALNNRKETRSHDHLEDDAKKALEAALTVQTTLQQLRSLQQSNATEFERETYFDLAEVFDEIEKMLGGALSRNNVSIKREFPSSLPLYGARTVLNHVFFNLVINSIDAARARETRRSMLIHVKARIEPQGNRRLLVVHFWDEGPGINRREFPNPAEIFEIGRTTKATGTGTGLPVARTLLGRYYKGNLTIEDPETARFKITIPLP
jgi:signal transduction histidine kinase